MAKKILLIEDEFLQVKIYERVIRDAGFEIESLRWGRDGLKRLEEIKAKEKEKPDLILLDLILPDINGITILKKAKTDPELRDIPVFVLTNYSSPDIDKTVKDLKAEKHVIKSDITPRQLVEFVEEWLGKEES